LGEAAQRIVDIAIAIGKGVNRARGMVAHPCGKVMRVTVMVIAKVFEAAKAIQIIIDDLQAGIFTADRRHSGAKI